MVMRRALCESGSGHEFLPLFSTAVAIYNLCKLAYEIFKNIRLNIPVKHSPFKNEFRVERTLIDYLLFQWKYVCEYRYYLANKIFASLSVCIWKVVLTHSSRPRALKCLD